MQNKYYVYLHLTKDTCEVFHVGMGSGDRASKLNRRNRYHKFTVAKRGCAILIFKYFRTKTEAFETEIKLIKYYKSRGLCKTNFHPGGAGGDTFSSLPENIKAEFRIKMSKITAARPIKCLRPLTGKAHPNFGKSTNKGLKHSDKFKENCRISKLGNKNPRYGKLGKASTKFIGWYSTPAGIFESRQAANLANNTTNTKYRCRSSKFKNWYFIPKELV